MITSQVAPVVMNAGFNFNIYGEAKFRDFINSLYNLTLGSNNLPSPCNISLSNILINSNDETTYHYVTCRSTAVGNFQSEIQACVGSICGFGNNGIRINP